VTNFDCHDVGVNENEELGRLIKEARIAQGLSVVAAAKKAKIARDTWKKIEAGASVHDTKRKAAREAVGLTLGWTTWDPEAFTDRRIDLEDPVDAALHRLMEAANALVQAENQHDAEMRRWCSAELISNRLDELVKERLAAGDPPPSAEELEKMRASIPKPTPAEVAELMAWCALHDPREWTRYEMALVEHVFDDYPKDPRSGSTYADLGVYRERVARLNPRRARDVGPDREGGDEDERPAPTKLPDSGPAAPARTYPTVVEEAARDE